MKIVRIVDGIYTQDDILEEFECFEDAQDSYIDSYINEFSQEISKSVNVNFMSIEFSDVLWKNSYIDIVTNIEDEKAIHTFNWDTFVKIGSDDDEEKYEKLVKELENSFKTIDPHYDLLIRIRFELDKSDIEIKKDLILELEKTKAENTGVEDGN